MDNERPIEKLLRRYAKKRRDESGPPTELHPATRRLLQGEVARQYGKGGTSKPERKWTPWRIVGAAVGFAVFVAFVIPAFLPALSKSKTKNMAVLTKSTFGASDQTDAELAGRRDLPAETPAPPVAAAEPQPAFVPAAVPPASNLPRPAREAEGGGVAENTDGNNSAPPAALPAGTLSAWQSTSATNYVAMDRLSEDARKKSPATLSGEITDQSATTVTAAAAGQSVAYYNSQNGISQKFMNSAGAAKDQEKSYGGGGGGAGAQSAVLNNFSCRQNGNQLIVLDGDGSLYSGSIQPGQAANFSTVTATRAVPETQLDDQAVQTRQNYSFRVEGTNLTLNAPVVFSGNLVPLNVNMSPQTQNANVSQQQNINAGPAQEQNASQNIPSQNIQTQSNLQQPVSLLQNAVITGNARVGDKTDVPVNAVPVNP